MSGEDTPRIVRLRDGALFVLGIAALGVGILVALAAPVFVTRMVLEQADLSRDLWPVLYFVLTSTLLAPVYLVGRALLGT